MTDKEFRCLLDLFMVSDPWPLEDGESNEIIGKMLDRLSRERGYQDWVGAFHRFGKGDEKPTSTS